MHFADNWDDEQSSKAYLLKGPVLIVGASGFIGAKLFFSLAKRRDDVWGASSSAPSGWRFCSWEQKAKLRNLDVTSYEQVRQLIHMIRPRTVFNLSAYGAYARQTDVERIHRVNFMGVVNLIRALEEYGCDAFVQAGSSSEYGDNSHAPNEADALLPNSDYAVSKGAASLLINYYGNKKDFPCTNLRIYSAYGPWEDNDRLIAKLVAMGVQRWFPSLVSGDISRDFVYVDDVTNAFVQTAVMSDHIEKGMSLNIGTGVCTTIREVCYLAKDIFDIEYEPKFGSMPNRSWDLSDWVADPSAAEKLLGWKATTTLRQGIELTRDWVKAGLKK